MTDWYEDASLPKFENPPVVETAMALEFPIQESLDIFKLSRLQAEWEDRYPDVQEVPGAPPTPQWSDGAMEIQFGIGGGPRRLWATQPDTGLLVQTQNDRLILNWRKAFSRAGYPGYSALRSEYARLWSELEGFLDRSSASPVRPHLAEFTYVNVVPMAETEKVADVVTLLSSEPTEMPGEDRFARFQFIREVAASSDHPFPAQVHISGEPQPTDGGRSLVFTVTARVVLEAGSSAPIEGIDAAHALASHTFDRIIPGSKHVAWGRAR